MKPTKSLGERLIDVGWQQGSLFQMSSVCFQWNAVSDPGSQRLTSPKARQEKAAKLVMATHTCDLKSDLESRVEALACNVHKKTDFLLNADRNSIRWFLIDLQQGLVAESRHRLVIDKAALEQVIPEPWPGGATRLDRFRDWLGRRFDRPALPDALVEAFQWPVEGVLKRLTEEDPDMAAAFSQAVHELRVSMPSSGQPPFDLQVVAMIRQRMGHDRADAIDVVWGRIRAELDPTKVRLDPRLRMLTEEEITLAEFRGTRPLFLEYLTYEGEGIEGAEPFRGAR